MAARAPESDLQTTGPAVLTFDAGGRPLLPPSAHCPLPTSRRRLGRRQADSDRRPHHAARPLFPQITPAAMVLITAGLADDRAGSTFPAGSWPPPGCTFLRRSRTTAVPRQQSGARPSRFSHSPSRTVSPRWHRSRGDFQRHLPGRDGFFVSLRHRLDSLPSFHRRPAPLPSIMGEQAGLIGAVRHARGRELTGRCSPRHPWRRLFTFTGSLRRYGGQNCIAHCHQAPRGK